MKMGDTVELSVIAPCLNEEANIGELVERTLGAVREAGLAAELVLVDDGSSGGTWDQILNAGSRDDGVRGVRHECNQGIEAGWRSGLDAARGQLVCLIDSDLQNQPEDIPRLYERHVAESPDIVQGVRHPRGVSSRHISSRVLNFMLNTAFGMKLRDNKSGFLLCRRETLALLLEHRFHYRYYQSFVGVAAGTRGLTVVELDTDFEPRKAGESFLSNYPVVVSARICLELIKFRVETLLFRRRDQARNDAG